MAQVSAVQETLGTGLVGCSSREKRGEMENKEITKNGKGEKRKISRAKREFMKMWREM